MAKRYRVTITVPFKDSTEEAAGGDKPAINGQLLAVGTGSMVRVAAMRAVEQLVITKHLLPAKVVLAAYRIS